MTLLPQCGNALAAELDSAYSMSIVKGIGI